MQPDGGSKEGEGENGGGEGTVLAKQRDSHPSSQRNPSASCLAGFITAPFITACLNNAVVVPIVNHVLTYIPSAHRTLPRDGGWIDRHFRYLAIAIAVESKVGIPPFLIPFLWRWFVIFVRSSFVSKELYSKVNLLCGNINNCIKNFES